MKTLDEATEMFFSPTKPNIDVASYLANHAINKYAGLLEEVNNNNNVKEMICAILAADVPRGRCLLIAVDNCNHCLQVVTGIALSCFIQGLMIGMEMEKSEWKETK